MNYGFYSHVFPFESDLTHPLLTLISVGLETRQGDNYYYDNSNRLLNGYLFQYTIDGKGFLEVGDKRYTLTKNQALFIPIPSDTKYYGDPHEPWSFYYILIQSDYLNEYYSQINQQAGDVLTLMPDSAVIAQVTDIINLAKNNHITSFNIASTLAFEFINKLHSYYTDNTENYSRRNKEILHLFESEFAHIDGISAVADRYNISLNHLTREFTEEVGMSPLKYLTRIRIQNAKKLLQTTNMTVKEIANACGYTRANYFCKIFKENVGYTPLVYRSYLS